MAREQKLSVIFDRFPSLEDLERYNEMHEPFRDIIEIYSEIGFGINQELYNVGGPYYGMPGRSIGDRRNAIYALKMMKVFDRVPLTSSPIVAWSGRSRPETWKTRNVGDTYTARGFFSLSLSMQPITAAYIDFESKPFPSALLQVTIPAKFPVAFASHETQLILPVGTMFKITGKGVETFLDGWKEGLETPAGELYTVETFFITVMGIDKEFQSSLQNDMIEELKATSLTK